ncbi:hypothetical protein ACIPLC_19440 [Kitasatospora sp. NPDC086801]|uniref:hypothetical protein n=1 Tax=Kitasatospora sp. NPDC086801 TaxID=3364066 RepID=UPI0037F61E51
MRANHATKPQEPAPRGVGARCAIGRWLPRALAAGGALLAQLWGFGAPCAYASADPLPEQATVRRTAPGGPAHGQSAPRDGQSAHAGPSTPEGPAPEGPAAEEAARTSPGLVGELADTASASGTGTGIDGAAGAVGSVLQDRIRAGGLPLPGQRAAVPDAFALASGLLDTVPAQGRPAETRASRDGEPAELPATARSGATGVRSAAPSTPGGRALAAGAPPVQETATPNGRGAAGPATNRDQAGAAVSRPIGPGAPAETPEETLALADTATVTAVDDGSATATAVLAPIAAGLLLTGAAMCKHRGLPRGH